MWVVRSSQLALTVVVTWFIADRIGVGVEEVSALDQAWWTPAWPLLFAATALLLATNFCSGVVWGRMVDDLGGGRLAPTAAIQVFLLANLGRYVPGKLWQVAGLVVLAKRRGVPGTVATGAAVIGHGLSLCAATLVGGAFFARSTLGNGLPGWTLLLAIAAILLLVCTPPVFRRVTGLWSRLAHIDLNPGKLHPLRPVQWVVMFVIVWIAYGSAFVLFAQSFGIGGAPLSIGTSFVAAYVVGYLAVFAPAGIGVREVALIGLLSPVAGAAAATGLAVVARLWVTAVEILPGVFMMSSELSIDRARGPR